MKKWLIAIIIVLIIIIGLILVLPFAMGFAIQHKYTKILDALSASGEIKLKIMEYHRGWFHSDAKVQLTVTDPGFIKMNNWLTGEEKGAPLQFIITEQITHGPFLFLTDSTGKKRILLGEAFIKSQIREANLLANSDTLVKLTGALENTTDIPNIAYKNPLKGVGYILKGLNFRAQISSNLDKVVGEGSVAEVNITNPEYQQHTQGLSVRYNLKKDGDNLYLGERETRINSTTWKDADDKQRIVMNGLTVKSTSAEQNSKANYLIDIALNNISFDHTQYGPNYLTLAIKNVDVPFLLALQSELQSQENTEGYSASDLIKYNELIVMLLNKGMDIELQKLDIATPWGRAAAKAHAIFASQPNMSTNPMVLLSHMNLSLNLHLPVNMINQAVEKFYQATASNKEVVTTEATQNKLISPITPTPTPVALTPQQE